MQVRFVSEAVIAPHKSKVGNAFEAGIPVALTECPVVADSGGSQFSPKAANGSMDVRRRSVMRDLSSKAALEAKKPAEAGWVEGCR